MIPESRRLSRPAGGFFWIEPKAKIVVVGAEPFPGRTRGMKRKVTTTKSLNEVKTLRSSFSFQFRLLDEMVAPLPRTRRRRSLHPSETIACHFSPQNPDTRLDTHQDSAMIDVPACCRSGADGRSGPDDSTARSVIGETFCSKSNSWGRTGGCFQDSTWIGTG